jgi:hypothetical protein
MKSLILFPPFLLLTACTTVVPVTTKFPEASQALRTACPQLDTVKKDDSKLSDMMTVVTKNYVKYHDCAAKVDAWNEWYKSQKQIFENATK